MRIGALEAGGTKMVCAIGDEHGRIEEQQSIPTRTPEETMPELIAYFQKKNIEVLGVAAFGPVGVNPDAPKYGWILDTSKLAWRQYPLLEKLQTALSVPIGLDTDVNGSCLGEMTYGAARTEECDLYYGRNRYRCRNRSRWKTDSRYAASGGRAYSDRTTGRG